VLLFVPLYVLTRTMDRHIEAVREETVASVDQVREETVASVDQVRAEAVSSVETLTERVSSFEGDVEQRLTDIARSVDDRLTRQREHEQALRDAVREVPTLEAVVEMLESAESRGLISLDRAPRVAATENEWGLYVGISLQMGSPVLQVESFSGKVIDGVVWGGSDSVEDVMFGVANIVQREVGISLQTTGFFTGLSEMLDVASTAPERRPIVQLCPPLWAVTARGIVAYGDGSNTYSLRHERLREAGLRRHMAAKAWADEHSFDLAVGVSSFLFPAPSDEVPF
jgi:hypothetical protein